MHGTDRSTARTCEKSRFERWRQPRPPSAASRAGEPGGRRWRVRACVSVVPHRFLAPRSHTHPNTAMSLAWCQAAGAPAAWPGQLQCLVLQSRGPEGVTIPVTSFVARMTKSVLKKLVVYTAQTGAVSGFSHPAHHHFLVGTGGPHRPRGTLHGLGRRQTKPLCDGGIMKRRWGQRALLGRPRTKIQKYLVVV